VAVAAVTAAAAVEVTASKIVVDFQNKRLCT
jgi:hypothetical protein